MNWCEQKIRKHFRMSSALHVGASRSLVARLPWAHDYSFQAFHFLLVFPLFPTNRGICFSFIANP
jgi:hypothetical protein